MTPTETTTLTDFLLARIAEDEAVARRLVIPAHGERPELSTWRYKERGEVEYDYDDKYSAWYVTCDSEGLLPAVSEEVGPHIARHDPARVLAECEAKRLVVVFCNPNDGYEGYILRCLALPYADHPDYREEWKP